MTLDILSQIIFFIFWLSIIIIVSYDLIVLKRLRAKLYKIPVCRQCKKKAEIVCNEDMCNISYCRKCYNGKGYCIECKSNSVRRITSNDNKITLFGYFVFSIGVITLLIGLFIDLTPIFTIAEIIFITRMTIIIISIFPLSLGLRKMKDIIIHTIKPEYDKFINK